MNEMASLALSSAAGVGLGAVFFGGLWWTVRRIASSQQAGLWILGSVLLRMGIAMGGFYVVAQGSWERLLACLAGFGVARAGVTWLTREPKRPGDWRQAASHAP